MDRFGKILFVSRSERDETEALSQALALASADGASVEVLVICPRLPPAMEDYRERYGRSLTVHAETAVNTALASLDGPAPDWHVRIHCTASPAIDIVRRVQRDGFDLVMTPAESAVAGRGFKALEQTLLRKCPAPVWLCRAFRHPLEQARVAVAVDPEESGAAGRALTLALLIHGRRLADLFGGALYVISAWDYEFEDFLQHNTWVDISESEAQSVVAQAWEAHRAALDEVVAAAGIGGEVRVRQPKGLPERVVPQVVEREAVDLVVMGSVARTGISGWLIGNTAENITQKLDCSLLTLKPQGFVSPIRPD